MTIAVAIVIVGRWPGMMSAATNLHDVPWPVYPQGVANFVTGLFGGMAAAR